MADSKDSHEMISETKTSSLVRKAKAGDQDRLGRLLVRMEPALRKWAGRKIQPKLGRHFDEDDLIQETNRQAMRSLHNFDPDKGTFRQWVFRIAGRCLMRAVKRWKKEKRQDGIENQTGDSAQVSKIAADMTSPSGRVANRESKERAIKEIDALPLEKRVLLQPKGDRPADAEIGAQLGITPNNVQVRRSREIRKLRKKILGE
jgi:RNA polymerase sigma factor (sigma-70 family)